MGMALWLYGFMVLGTHFSRLSCDPEAAKTNMGTTRPPLPRPVETKGTHTCKRLLAVMVVGGIVEGGWWLGFNREITG